MTYKIWCKQRQQYFSEGVEFGSLEEIREQLISYHIDDCDEPEILQRLPLWEILEVYEWETHEQLKD